MPPSSNARALDPSRCHEASHGNSLDPPPRQERAKVRASKSVQPAVSGKDNVPLDRRQLAADLSTPAALLERPDGLDVGQRAERARRLLRGAKDRAVHDEDAGPAGSCHQLDRVSQHAGARHDPLHVLVELAAVLHEVILVADEDKRGRPGVHRSEAGLGEGAGGRKARRRGRRRGWVRGCRGRRRGRRRRCR